MLRQPGVLPCENQEAHDGAPGDLQVTATKGEDSSHGIDQKDSETPAGRPPIGRAAPGGLEHRGFGGVFGLED